MKGNWCVPEKNRGGAESNIPFRHAYAIKICLLIRKTRDLGILRLFGKHKVRNYRFIEDLVFRVLMRYNGRAWNT